MLTPEHIKALTTFNNKYNNNGYNYVIVTKEENGDVIFHERVGEPCYGGLRKYKSTHGEECNQPEAKPGDLLKPFPKTGEPIALSFPFRSVGVKKYSKIINFMWGPNSPWIKGFGSVDNLIPTFKDKIQTGFILTSTDIEPTVLVNLLKITNRSVDESMLNKFNRLQEEGLDEFEALNCTLFDYPDMYNQKDYIKFENDYIMPVKCDFKKMRAGEANEFSGGTLRMRKDYSRKRMQDVFYDEKGITLAAELKKRIKGPTFTVSEYAKAAKEVFKTYG